MANSHRSPTESINVLAVDDDPGYVDLIGDFLEKETDVLSVVTETSAAAGLDRLRNDEFECVVSDYQMPGMGGIEFLRTIREEYSELPFILFTSKGSEEIASEAIAAGVTDYLQKGTGTDTYVVLANRITNAVDQYRARRRAAHQERRLRILRDVNQGLVEARTRQEIETAICDRFATADPYCFAWMGEYEPDTDRVISRAGVGGDFDAANLKSASTIDDGLVREALQTQQTSIGQPADLGVAMWDSQRCPLDSDSVGVIPIYYHGHHYGVLILFATRPDAFDADERDMLAEIAGDAGQAIHTAELMTRLEQHQTAVENVPDGVFILDEDATIELVNQPAADLIDYPLADLQTLPFPTLVSEGIFDEDIIDWYLESVRTLLSSSTDKEAARYETTVQPNDGESLTVEVHLSLRPYDEEFRGTVGIIRDVTEQKRQEQELIAAKERYELLVENAPVPIILYDSDGVLFFANDAAVDFIGAEEATEIIGRKAIEFVHDEDRELAANRMQRVLTEGEPVEPVELSVVDLQGDRKVVIGAGAPVQYEDELVGQVVLEDITEQRAQTKRLRAERDRLDRFAETLSHDLRNPLNIAQSYLDLLAEDCESEYLEIIGDAHDRIDTRIDEILRLTQEGRKVENPEPVRLSDIATQAWQFIEVEDAMLEVDAELTLMGDENRLQRLFENLFRNALEHAGPDVNITIGSLSDGFYVADDGPGIPPDKRERVFDVGYSTRETGSGFGLGIVKQIANAHDWTVAITDSVAGGAQFEFTDVTVAKETTRNG